MNNSLSRQILLSILGIAILIIAVLGISYAIFVTTLTGTKENEITTGTISMSFVESNDGISMFNAMPLSNSEGMKLNGTRETYDFVVNSIISGATTVNYEVVAEKIIDDYTILPNSDIRLYLEKYENGRYVPTEITSTPKPFEEIGEVTQLGSPADGMLLYKGEFVNDGIDKKNFSDSFRLRMWIADSSVIDQTSRKLKLRVNVYGKVL